MTPPTPINLERRFGGMDRLYGPEPARQLRTAHVCVVGVGGVGSWVVEALARSGVGRLTLVDMDHVAESNINRQIHALDTTLGQAKVAAMAERVALINPGCQVQQVDDFLTPDNAQELLGRTRALVEGAGLVLVDACDQLAAKLAMVRWARQHRVPLVVVGAAGGKRLPHAVDVADLAEVTHDPLLAQLRYRLRKHDGAPRQGRMKVTCVFSREAVQKPLNACGLSDAASTDGSLNCHGYGSVVTVTASFGMAAAAQAMAFLV